MSFLPWFDLKSSLHFFVFWTLMESIYFFFTDLKLVSLIMLLSYFKTTNTFLSKYCDPNNKWLHKGNSWRKPNNRPPPKLKTMIFLINSTTLLLFMLWIWNSIDWCGKLKLAPPLSLSWLLQINNKFCGSWSLLLHVGNKFHTLQWVLQQWACWLPSPITSSFDWFYVGAFNDMIAT